MPPLSAARAPAAGFQRPVTDQTRDLVETLLAVLRLLAQDFVPETCAAADVINSWLAEHQPKLERQRWDAWHMLSEPPNSLCVARQLQRLPSPTGFTCSSACSPFILA